MPASRLHLVRHGEVFNPEGVLYERIDGFGLSELGEQMAKAAADSLVASGRSVRKLIVSPLLRAQQSARPIAEAFGLEPVVDERVIEPWNEFRGLKIGVGAILRRPSIALKLFNPSKPSWGEPFVDISARMLESALENGSTDLPGDVVIVSHQLPIWMLYRFTQGLAMPHDPRSRRCSLSSITSFEIRDDKLVEVDYREPGVEFANSIEKSATDGGAV
jgi:broad specificity phosphatase PhoE